MNLFKKTICFIQTLTFFTFLPALSMANSWVDHVEISKDLERLYFTQTKSVKAEKKAYIHFKTPATKNIVFSQDSGPKRKTLFKFTDTGKKLAVGQNSYYLFRFENAMTKKVRCFYADKDPGMLHEYFGFNLTISKEDFFPNTCKIDSMVGNSDSDSEEDNKNMEGDNKNSKGDNKKNVSSYIAKCVEVESSKCNM